MQDSEEIKVSASSNVMFINGKKKKESVLKRYKSYLPSENKRRRLISLEGIAIGTVCFLEENIDGGAKGVGLVVTEFVGVIRERFWYLYSLGIGVMVSAINNFALSFREHYCNCGGVGCNRQGSMCGLNQWQSGTCQHL